MSLSLECKKAKRTGFIPAFLCGGILAAAVPIVNMAVLFLVGFLGRLQTKKGVGADASAHSF